MREMFLRLLSVHLGHLLHHLQQWSLSHKYWIMQRLWYRSSYLHHRSHSELPNHILPTLHHLRRLPLQLQHMLRFRHLLSLLPRLLPVTLRLQLSRLPH